MEKFRKFFPLNKKDHVMSMRNSEKFALKKGGSVRYRDSGSKFGLSPFGFDFELGLDLEYSGLTIFLWFITLSYLMKSKITNELIKKPSVPKNARYVEQSMNT